MILCLETSTKNCSVALFDEGQLLGFRSEYGQKFVHGERLHVLVQDLLIEFGVTIRNIKAVCVGKGPGSYTGLRIGVSTAKGLCYAAQVPLWSVPTLGCFNKEEFQEGATIISVIDARRDEVFAQVWKLEQGTWSSKTEVAAVIVDNDSFSDWQGDQTFIVGDCADKVEKLLGPSASNFKVLQNEFPDARHMKLLLNSAYRNEESVAYFEPFYLKDFVAEKSKKKWL